MTDEEAAAFGRLVHAALSVLNHKFTESESTIRQMALTAQQPDWEDYQWAYVQQLDALQIFFTHVSGTPLPDNFRAASVAVGEVLKGKLHPMFTPKAVRQQKKMGRVQHSFFSDAVRIMAVLAVDYAKRRGMKVKQAQKLLSAAFAARGYFVEPETIRDWSKEKDNPFSAIGIAYAANADFIQLSEIPIDTLFDNVALEAGKMPA